MKLLYVTTNPLKFGKAVEHLGRFGLELEQRSFEFQEIQREESSEIALDKAQQAFQAFQQPVLVSDDSWRIPALRGFPGPYMRQLNHWFKPDDWLRLMAGVADRRIQLHSCLVYQDEAEQRSFEYTKNFYFLHEADQQEIAAPHLRVISLTTDGPSVAQEIQAQGFSLGDSDQVWQEMANWLQSR